MSEISPSLWILMLMDIQGLGWSGGEEAWARETGRREDRRQSGWGRRGIWRPGK